MVSSIKIKIYLLFIFLFFLFNNYSIARENKLFWDGLDWNRITKSVDYNNEQTFKIKTAYLHGALDGRLNYYLKTCLIWVTRENIHTSSTARQKKSRL